MGGDPGWRGRERRRYRTNPDTARLQRWPSPVRGPRPLRARRRPAQGHRRADRGLERGDRYQTLLGVTGVGQDDDPGATSSPTTASRRWSSRTTRRSPPSSTASSGSSFPHNAVEYFVSYYDYYQPEAYVPSTDMYIEKDASINEDIERLRLRATSSLMEREDVVIVATVSAIYGLGDPVEYRELMVTRRSRASSAGATTILARAGAHPVRPQRRRLRAGHLPRARRHRSRSSRPTRSRRSASSSGATRSSGSARSTRSPATPSPQLDQCAIYPAKHFVTQRPTIERAVQADPRRAGGAAAASCKTAGQAARGAAARVAHQLRHRDAARGRHLRRHRELLAPPHRPRGRASGPPACSTTSRADFLVVVDESHVTLPQIGGMFNGDRARKLTLVEYGFRLPSRARQPAAAVRRVHGAGRRR